MDVQLISAILFACANTCSSFSHYAANMIFIIYNQRTSSPVNAHVTSDPVTSIMTIFDLPVK